MWKLALLAFFSVDINGFWNFPGAFEFIGFEGPRLVKS
jgi:hypothetical protein